MYDGGYYLGRGPHGTGECHSGDRRPCLAGWQTLAFFGPEITDRDGDNVADEYDVYPRDSTEWWDSDGDGVGDNSDDFPFDATLVDGDWDGDGIEDDIDKLGILTN